MNLRSSGSLVLSKAIQGFISFKSAEGLSDRTVDSYDRLLQKWLEYAGDREVGKITAAEITGYSCLIKNGLNIEGGFHNFLPL